MEEVAISPTRGSLSRWPTNWRTTMPKKFSHYCKSSRAQDRFPKLGIQQRDWEPPSNLMLKASEIWWWNFHRTGESDSLRAQTKSDVYQDPGEKSSVPTRDRAGLVCECPGVTRGGMDQQWPIVGSGALNTTLLWAMVGWHKSSWRRPQLQLPPSPLASTLGPWKKSYDQPRHHIKKQRHYFTKKGPSE